ncbi:MAG: MFS transporter [Anaerolineae bacterium]
MPQRSILLYMAAVGMVGFTIDGGIYAVVYNLFVLRLGYGADFIGLLASVSLVGFTLAGAVAGPLGDRVGSRRMLLLGLGAMVVALAAMPLTALLPPDNQSAGLIALFSVANMGLAAFFVNAPPYISAIAAPSILERVFAYQTALWAFCAFLGGLIGGFLPASLAAALGWSLDNPAPYAVPLIVAALGMAAAFTAIVFTENATPHAAHGKAAGAIAFPLGIVVVLGLVRFFHAGTMGAVLPFFNVYMDSALQAPTAQIGIVTACGRLLAAFLALLTPIVARRWGNRNIVTWGSAMMSLAVVPMILIPDAVAASFGFISVASLSSMRYAAFIAFAMKIVPPQRRGLLAGVSETSAGVSFALTAFLGGQIITRLGYPPLFTIGCIMGLIGSAIFWVYFQSRRGVAVGAEAGLPGDV